jgi:hypothetical protein
MAKHNVTLTLPERPLGKVDAEFAIKKYDVVLGTLKLSQGGAEWFGKHAKKGKKISWSTLAQLIENHN